VSFIIRRVVLDVWKDGTASFFSFQQSKMSNFLVHYTWGNERTQRIIINGIKIAVMAIVVNETKSKLCLDYSRW
jgi:hypothetical protein